jgi:hypothetical protein
MPIPDFRKCKGVQELSSFLDLLGMARIDRTSPPLE